MCRGAAHASRGKLWRHYALWLTVLRVAWRFASVVRYPVRGGLEQPLCVLPRLCHLKALADLTHSVLLRAAEAIALVLHQSGSATDALSWPCSNTGAYVCFDSQTRFALVFESTNGLATGVAASITGVGQAPTFATTPLANAGTLGSNVVATSGLLLHVVLTISRKVSGAANVTWTVANAVGGSASFQASPDVYGALAYSPTTIDGTAWLGFAASTNGYSFQNAWVSNVQAQSFVPNLPPQLSLVSTAANWAFMGTSMWVAAGSPNGYPGKHIQIISPQRVIFGPSHVRLCLCRCAVDSCCCKLWRHDAVWLSIFRLAWRFASVVRYPVWSGLEQSLCVSHSPTLRQPIVIFTLFHRAAEAIAFVLHQSDSAAVAPSWPCSNTGVYVCFDSQTRFALVFESTNGLATGAAATLAGVGQSTTFATTPLSNAGTLGSNVVATSGLLLHVVLTISRTVSGAANVTWTVANALGGSATFRASPDVYGALAYSPTTIDGTAWLGFAASTNGYSFQNAWVSNVQAQSFAPNLPPQLSLVSTAANWAFMGTSMWVAAGSPNGYPGKCVQISALILKTYTFHVCITCSSVFVQVYNSRLLPLILVVQCCTAHVLPCCRTVCKCLSISSMERSRTIPVRIYPGCAPCKPQMYCLFSALQLKPLRLSSTKVTARLSYRRGRVQTLAFMCVSTRRPALRSSLRAPTDWPLAQQHPPMALVKFRLSQTFPSPMPAHLEATWSQLLGFFCMWS